MDTQDKVDLNWFFDDFEKLVNDDAAVVRRKNSDYSDSPDPFHNFEVSAQLAGITVEQGIFVRMVDKVLRVSNLLKRKNFQGEVAEEAITDSLSDMRNYASLLQLHIEYNKEEQTITVQKEPTPIDIKKQEPEPKQNPFIKLFKL